MPFGTRQSQDHEKKKKSPETPSPISNTPPSTLHGASPEAIISLQRTHGNQAVQRMISSGGLGMQIQRKLHTATSFEALLTAPTITRKHAYRRAASSMKTIVEILDDNSKSEAQKIPLLKAAVQYVKDNKPDKAIKYDFPLRKLLERIDQTENELIEASADPLEKRREIFEQSEALRDNFNKGRITATNEYDDLGSDDQGAIASIVREYGTLQAMLRNNKQKPSVKEMVRADKIVKAFSKMAPSAGRQERESDHFPNGSEDDKTLVPGEIYTDNGFFFAGDSALVSGKYKMIINFTHAYFVPSSVAEGIFGHKEPQYIMLPGSSFRYDGKAEGRYVFTQVS